MNRTPAETQARHDECVAKFAQPDPEVRTIAGRDWARVRPMKCPTCTHIFYGWTPLDSPAPPYQVDDAPGQRQTCGHPLCHKAEEDHAFHARHH